MKVGDRVTVYRKVKSSVWISDMDETVGLSGVIVKVAFDSADVKLDVPPVGNFGQWFYPLSSLKYESSK